MRSSSDTDTGTEMDAVLGAAGDGAPGVDGYSHFLDELGRPLPGLGQPTASAPTGGQGSAEERVRRFGRAPAAPFLLGPGRQVVELDGGAVTGVARPLLRYALMATGPAAPPGTEEVALDSLLGRLQDRRLRPVFAAVPDPAPYLGRGLHSEWVGDDATVELADFTLAGSRRANVRHSVTSARRTGLRVVPWAPELAEQVTAVSTAWLAGKGGREFGFTVGQFDPRTVSQLDCRVALDERGRVCGFVTWLVFDDGRARALDLTRRHPHAPNPTMDLLVAESLLEFATAGVERASLGLVLRSATPWLERFYPTRSLRWYKDKFAPRWVPQHMVVPSHRCVAGAGLALARACGPQRRPGSRRWRRPPPAD